MNSLSVDFFLGANSEHGFFSHFDQLQDPYSDFQTFIIKAGPGTGKSTMMKKLARRYTDRERLVERVHCSSDPDSLDGVILHDNRIQIVDGTPPHVMEPRFAAAGETILSFYPAFCEKELRKHRLEIAQTSSVISGFHRRFCELLRCANLLLDSNAALIRKSLNQPKLERAVQGILKRELSHKKKQEGMGLAKTRLVSAFTPKGLITYQDTINTLCGKVYLLDDEYRICSHLFLTIVRDTVLKAGYDCYVCYSPFHPDTQIDQVLIPDLGLGFVTRSRFLPLEQVHANKVIHATRFFDREILRQKKQRLSFCRKTAAAILEEALEALAQAKAAHDVLEEFYAPNVDFSVVDQITEEFFNRLEA